jgi:hypothetical protein
MRAHTPPFPSVLIFLLFLEGIKNSENPQYTFLVACHYYCLSGLLICPSFQLSKAVGVCQFSMRKDGHKIE